jgi:hypothetical protein
MKKITAFNLGARAGGCITQSHRFSVLACNMGAFPPASRPECSLPTDASMSTRFPIERLITNYFMASSYRWNLRDQNVRGRKFCVKAAKMLYLQSAKASK